MKQTRMKLSVIHLFLAVLCVANILLSCGW